MRSCTPRNFLGSKVRIYIGLYAITNNYCVFHARNDFYLPATLHVILHIGIAVDYMYIHLAAWEFSCSLFVVCVMWHGYCTISF